ncbi:type II secretion system protein N [Hyphomonas pacifica]|uniref:type II secretion system protein N n=1 Tax=Hyphomonas pacifica TaxID=1280941 RepID=UPI000DC0483F|nr:type II secretion system protein N [Hyphomonas pacifica]RAN33121.1 hypothetical protein HY11_16990 [Hyphomonas pacifica]
MMRLRTLYIMLFAVSILAGLVAFAPLSFVMRYSGLSSQGIGWQQARGSVWNGQLTGLVWKGHSIGAVNLEAQPTLLFKAAPWHEAIWSGPAGQGRAFIGFKGRALDAQGVSASLYVDRFVGLDPSLSNLGSTVRLSSVRLMMDGERCKLASGIVTTDLARLAAVAYDRDWPILSGPLSCEQGELTARMSGQADDGATIVLDAKLSSGVRLEIEPADEDLRGVLKLAGFKAEGTKLVHVGQAQRQETHQ